MKPALYVAQPCGGSVLVLHYTCVGPGCVRRMAFSPLLLDADQPQAPTITNDDRREAALLLHPGAPRVTIHMCCHGNCKRGSG